MRTATWTNIGTDVSGITTVDDVLRESGLNYEVEKRPIYVTDNSGTQIQIPNKVATVKKDTGEYIGVVSPNYTVYQNSDAFDFIDSIENVKFVKAGETASGMVYIIGKLPDVTVLGDTFTPHVIFQTSHNGVFNIKATICPLRIVCQNQFAMSFGSVRNTVNIRHSSQIVGRMTAAKRLIQDTAQYMNGFTDTAEELALLKLGSNQTFYNIVDAFFESTKEITERQQRALDSKKSQIIQCYNADDNSDFKGTVWGAVNAFTDFVTHEQKKQTKTMNESQFMNVTFDTAALTKFLTIAKSYV
jgi:phage/plasmid-like protein (TIGR03299 family)